MNIARILSLQAQARPDDVAVVQCVGGRRVAVSFGELELRSMRAAGMLSAAGLKPGDGVLMFHPMAVELYVALLAVFRLGLVAMFLDPSAGAAHIERCCEIYRPAAFFGSRKAHLLRIRSGALRSIPLKWAAGGWFPFTRRWEAPDGHEPYRGMHPCDLETPALLTFTSGSTGRPKAAMRTHGFLLSQRSVLTEALELSPGQVDLATLPIFVLANLGAGVTSVIPDADLRRPGAIEPKPVIGQVRAENCRTVTASPAFLERIVEECERRGEKLESFQRIYTGGAPVFPNLMRRLAAVAPNADVVPVYGSTEAEPIAEMRWSEMTEADKAAMAGGKGLLAGPPVKDITLRVMKQRWGSAIGQVGASQFGRECLGPNEPGEIVVTGEHVLKGYWKGQGDAETKFRVDDRVWHRTGDAGYLDDLGRLWLLGRCEARIDDARGTLFPFAVETAAMQHPAVRRAALIAQGGRRVLFVELNDGTPGTGPARVRAALEWAELDEVRAIDRIPLDARHNAKVDYPALRKLAGR